MVCGLCRQSGHNKRTCVAPSLTHDNNRNHRKVKRSKKVKLPTFLFEGGFCHQDLEEHYFVQIDGDDLDDLDNGDFETSKRYKCDVEEALSLSLLEFYAQNIITDNGLETRETRHESNGGKGNEGDNSNNYNNECVGKNECQICLEEMIFTTTRWSTTCGHVFHRICLEKAFIRKRECPLCRTVQE